MSRKNWTTEKLFYRLLNNKSERTSWDNIRELRSRGTEEVFVKSYELAHSDIVREKIFGIDLLAQLGSEPRPFSVKTIEICLKLLEKETNPKVLSSILYAIGHNNRDLTNAQILLLASFKNSKNHDIRQSLVHAFLYLDNDEAIETLILLMNDKIVSIRDWATFAIGTQIERDNALIRNALWQRVNDSDETTKFEAIVGLARRQDHRVKAILERELLNESFGSLMFEAIKELKDTYFIPALQDLFEKNKKDTNINKGWLNDLEECLLALKSLMI